MQLPRVAGLLGGSSQHLSPHGSLHVRLCVVSAFRLCTANQHCPQVFKREKLYDHFQSEQQCN
jgi:hypothetical protein